MKKILFFSAMALTTLSFGQNVPSYVSTNGLVGWYPFNGNANDESGNGNDGIVNGASITTDRNGNSNSAYIFNGTSDFINFLSSPIINDEEFSVSVWVYNVGVALNSSGALPAISFGYTGSNTSNEAYFGSHQYPPSNKIGFNTGGARNITSNGTINIGEWQNIILVHNNNGYNSSSFKFYVNATEYSINNTGGSGTPFPLNNSMAIGVQLSGSSTASFFNGAIDDIAIYNRALTQQEVTALYSSCSISATTIGAISSTTSGNNITMSATSSGSNLNYTWETNPINNGWQEVVSNSTYSGNGTSSLSISNLTLANHQQPFRVIASDNSCSDTSDVAYITLTDTCINTTSIAVTDTLIMDISLAGVSATNDVNTMKIYPNPTNDIVNIDNGNYTLMTGYSIKIMTAIGQEMFSSSITSQTIQVPVSQLGATGNYFINVYDNNQVLVESKVLILE